eukprot:gene10664-11793_t
MASPSSPNRAKRSRELSDICDTERSSQDDIFASQTRFRTPDEQEHEVHDDIDALLQGEQLESTTPTERNLTPAQKNLIKDLAKHKVTILKHQGMANHFRHLSQSGTIFPDYTQPALHLRDYKTFSSDSKSRLNTITKTFQRSVLELLSAHHDEVAANTKLLVDSRNDSITSIPELFYSFNFTPTTINMASPSSPNRAKRSRELSDICDTERSSQDDIFASQTRFRTPDEQEHE